MILNHLAEELQKHHHTATPYAEPFFFFFLIYVFTTVIYSDASVLFSLKRADIVLKSLQTSC